MFTKQFVDVCVTEEEIFAILWAFVMGSFKICLVKIYLILELLVFKLSV